ncbi:MAG: glycosyltransferase [Eubacteriales bacterium]|nr:glycosyltransferase [Eubacteriales bacterium]
MADRISVIVPAYNTAPWLVRCLDSLMAQTHPNMEVIVVNDGSTDDTRQVLDAYAAAHPVKVIHQENAGVTAARLRGVAEATGAWVGFVDGDDTVEPQMYARLLENAWTYDAQISHCGQQVIFPDGRITKVLDSGEIRIRDRVQSLKELLNDGTIESGLCTKLYRADLFEGLAGWMDCSIRNNEDLLMNYYLFSRSHRSVFEAVCPYHYILRQGSASYRALSHYLIFDPIRVRQQILGSCGPEMQAAAREALLRNLLFAYARLTMAPAGSFREEKAQVRCLLTQQKPWFSLLSHRNRLLANMIVTAPWTFRVSYRAFAALFLRKEQH